MIFRNSEHYYDPTAGQAIENVMRETKGLSDDSLESLRDDFERKMKKGERFIRVQDPRKNWDPEREKWEIFTTRIIVQAANDYRKASKVRQNADLPRARRTMHEVEEFFLSDWFMQMTNADGEKILKRLQREAGR